MILGICLTSCGFLEENNTSYPVPEKYYTSAGKIRTGLNGLYDPVRSIYSASMFLMTEAATDVIFLSSYTRPDANCVISPSKPCHGKNVWKQGYIGVMRANEMCAVIDNALEKGYIDEEEYKELYGEAVVMRAMYYYCLTSVFGDVPFYLVPVTEENRAEIAHLGRTSAYEIREVLIGQLMDLLLPVGKGGKEYLPLRRSYEEGTDYRAGAALGLMLGGKFCMWNGNVNEKRYEDAITLLSVLEEIYGGPFGESPESFEAMYPLTDIPFSKKWTKESIFEISNKVEDYGQQEYYTLASYCTPSRSTLAIEEDEDETDTGASVISNNYNGIIIPEMSAHARTYKAARPTSWYLTLLNYNSTDKRVCEYKEDSLEPIGSSGNLAYCWPGYSVDNPSQEGELKVLWFNELYDKDSDGNLKPTPDKTNRPWLGNKFWCKDMYYYRDSNNPKVFRLAGALLNLAEAYLMTGDTYNACRYLNVTMKRAGRAEYSSDDTDAIMEEIRNECARELFGEFQRKFDLVRWDIWYERTLKNTNSTYLKDYIRPYHRYYPIPADQVAYSGGALNNNDYIE